MLRHITHSYAKLGRNYHVGANSTDHYSILDMNVMNKSTDHSSFMYLAENNQLLKKNNRLLKENNQLLEHMNQILHKNAAIPARVEILEKMVHK